MTTLPDGTYDAFILWAEQRDDGVALECTITSGERRGDVVNIVTSSFVARDPTFTHRFAVHVDRSRQRDTRRAMTRTRQS